MQRTDEPMVREPLEIATLVLVANNLFALLAEITVDVQYKTLAPPPPYTPLVPTLYPEDGSFKAVNN